MENIGDRLQATICIVLIVSGCALAATGLWLSYSYWYDELYSVTAAVRPVPEIIRRYALGDVHPPLYLLILHGWEAIVGTSEIAVRALSEILAAAAAGLFAWFALRRLSAPAALSGIAFFTTVWIFLYYAQEARSYALMLILATLVTIGLLDYVRYGRGLYLPLAAGLALSLTHYFGLVYSGLVLIALLWHARTRRPDWLAIVMVGAICLAWPLIHYEFGAMGGYGGGEFWIRSNGLQTSLTKVALAFFPALPTIAGAGFATATTEWITAIVALASLIALVIGLRHDHESFALGLICLALIGVIGAIDYVSPISTHRNYIVLLPAIAFLVASMIEHTSRNTLRVALILVCVVNIAGSAVKIHRKAYPLENWQALNRMTPGPTYYLLIHPVNRPIQQRIVDFYLDHKAQPIAPQAVATLEPPYYVVAAHKEAIAARLTADPAIHARYPRDGSGQLSVLTPTSKTRTRPRRAPDQQGPIAV